MIFHQLAALLSSLTAEMQHRADAAEQRMHLLIVQPILERLNSMSVDVSKLVADFATFRGDLTTTLADARAKMDGLQALKLSDADAQAKIDALDKSLGDLEAQVMPPATPVTTAPVEVPPVVPASVDPSTPVVPVVPAPVSTDPAAPAPVPADPSAPAVPVVPVDPTVPVPPVAPTVGG